MARRPPRQRASGRAPDQARFVPVREPTFRQLDPLSRSPFPFAYTATTPYAAHLLGKTTTTDRNVLNAILEEWQHTNVHVETSIARISDRLSAARNSIRDNKISESLSRLVASGLIIKDESGHNFLRIRINPFMFWKGVFADCRRAQENERSEWPPAIDPAE